MRIAFVIALVAAFLSSSAWSASTPPAPMTPWTKKMTRIADSCCKRCSKGKACGNSCISRQKACHKGKGCACD